MCLPVLYRHVDLRSKEKQQHFVHTLISHPEYGKHVRSLKGTLWLSSFISLEEDAELWLVMQLLTHVRCVDITSKNDFDYLRWCDVTN